MAAEELDAAAVERKGDLTVVLNNLKERQLLVIANIHRLPYSAQELLSEAARNHKIDVIIGLGSSARRHTLELRPFTLIGTAPRKSDNGTLLTSLLTHQL